MKNDSAFESAQPIQSLPGGMREALEKLRNDVDQRMNGFMVRARAIYNGSHIAEELADVANSLDAILSLPLPDRVQATGEGEARFFIDHGMIHDRLTGKHVVTDGKPPFEDGVEQVLKLLNELATPPSDVRALPTKSAMQTALGFMYNHAERDEKNARKVSGASESAEIYRDAAKCIAFALSLPPTKQAETPDGQRE